MILLLKGSKRVPGILIAVVGATIVVGALDLAARAGVSVLGSLPQGLPAFAIPWITYADIGPGSDRRLRRRPGVVRRHQRALARPMRRGRGPMSIPTRRWSGLGAANLAAGFFQGFPISSSSSRTPVAEAAGARTQLTGVVGALSVALLLLVAPDLLQHLPTSCIGGGRDRLGHRPDRGHRPRSNLSHPALGVLAIDRLLRSAWRCWARFRASAWRS